MVMGNCSFTMKALCLFLFSLILSTPALAEEVSSWEEVVEKENIKLSGEWVSIPPIPWRVPYDLLALPTPHPQPELHFSGDNGEGGTSVAQAMLAFPPISVGGQSVISPFFAFKGQSDGTREGQTLSVEGGLAISGDRGQLQFSIEEVIYPLPQTAYKVNAVLRF